ncbi:MAG: hypothetical protein J6O61_19155 [Butyrivibrio sp.]|uniref:hypothetical protein n=1 Tax=Butyrivibrio sp. TaxID=28121 RepID=UPI001B2256B0|nr:hypothetical protein [Butyrivibrio sp.]MBO6242922.1 hypothetical protein [Butyrivibrio sp.]
MSKPILCIGTYAKTPFHIEKVGKNVYCIEELCYILVNNAFLLDEDSFGDDLFDWIEHECSLERLSDELRSMAMKKCSIASLAGTILDYVGYNSKKEVDRTEEILRANAGMDVYRKKMARADFLLKNGRYSLAFKEYEFLLKNTDELDKKAKAKIEHNEGVMYARLFLFERAADMFLKAYKDGGDKESLIQYLGAMRMSLSDKEYVSFVADNEELYEISLVLEGKVNELEELFGSSKTNLSVGTMAVYKAEGKMNEYYDVVGNITQQLKTEYRDLVKDKVG